MLQKNQRPLPTPSKGMCSGDMELNDAEEMEWSCKACKYCKAGDRDLPLQSTRPSDSDSLLLVTVLMAVEEFDLRGSRMVWRCRC